MRQFTLIASMLLFATALWSQSLWNVNHMQMVKDSLQTKTYATAYAHLLNEAESKLDALPPSVMMKDKTPASGSKHDYMSMGRYFWPDTTKANGKPYVNRDGQTNPEIERLDRNRLSEMTDAVTTLALAYYFSDNEKYADKAMDYLRVWFLNDSSRMNPNLEYAQMIPGHNSDKGRSYGLIDTYSFVEMLDAVAILQSASSFTADDKEGLKMWFTNYLNWFINSPQGKEEHQATNNHGLAYDVQVVAFAIFIGNDLLAFNYIDQFAQMRLFKQIEPDGKQALELTRTLAFGYSVFNIHHMVDLFFFAEKMGRHHIDNSVSPDGRSFYKAVDFLVPYLGKSVKEWPYQQISDWENKQQALCDDLYRITLLNPSRTDYLQLYQTHNRNTPSSRFKLLYYYAHQ